MEKVLLAVDGVTPNKKAVRYAVELCKRIKADLNVLQLIGQRYMKHLGVRVNRARNFVEGSMIGATFAEAGEPEMAKALKQQALQDINQFLPEAERDAVHCHLSVRSGPSDQEIITYVNDHRDIVLTIYDAPAEETDDGPIERKRGSVLRIGRRISTPLVVLKG
jgi:nucleotide-binding universal stress UspA family protein